MSETDLGYLIAALIVAAISWRHNRRGVLWIGMAASSYINGDFAWRSGAPFPEALTAMGDAWVCLAVLIWARAEWEMKVWRLYQLSLLIGIVFFAANMGKLTWFGITPNGIPHFVYTSAMELINVLLLLLILGMSATQRIGAAGAGAHWPFGLDRTWNRVRGFAHTLRAQRSQPPFYKVP